MLSISGLNHFYGESHILWDMDLEIQEGACTCIMGRNGVGKTTLLRCVLGFLRHRSGSIRLDGTELSGMHTEQRVRLGVGYVPQGREIFPLLTVEENLRVGLRDGRREIPEHIFSIFPVLKDMLRRRGGDLSGGQQQQLAIGRALVLEPRLLILDEPTEGIQPNIVREIGDVLTDLNRKLGMTVLFVEQKLAFARRVADRFYILEKGRAVAQGGIGELDDRLIQQHLTV